MRQGAGLGLWPCKSVRVQHGGFYAYVHRLREPMHTHAVGIARNGKDNFIEGCILLLGLGTTRAFAACPAVRLTVFNTRHLWARYKVCVNACQLEPSRACHLGSVRRKDGVAMKPAGRRKRGVHACSYGTWRDAHAAVWISGLNCARVACGATVRMK